MAKYTYDFKHKIERESEKERERAKPGQAVYIQQRRVQNPFQHLSKEVISLELTIFTKISILDV